MSTSKPNTPKPNTPKQSSATAKKPPSLWWHAEDPHYAREAQRYERPAPSREFLLTLLDDAGHAMTREQIQKRLELDNEMQQEALSHRLRAMERDGQVLRNRRNAYAPVDNLDLVKGRVQAHPDGFGFLIPDDGSDDLYLAPREMRQVFHRDRVLARIKGVDRRGRRDGGIVEVLERNTEELVGRVQIAGESAFVAPTDKRLTQDVLVPANDLAGATDGQIVLVHIVQHPDKRRRAVGRVSQVLGNEFAPGMEIEIAMRNHGIPHSWPEAALAQAEAYGDQVPADAKAGRVDLRDTALVTIDGADARDFDDAVFAEKVGNGWRLLVAIADVSAYVSLDSPLDVEAQLRGNSVYFPQQVVPMLPEALSNGLCSLNPEVERLCMVCEMRINAAGKITRSKFYEAVMRSHQRFTYDRVWDLLSADHSNTEAVAALSISDAEQTLLPDLQTLYDLYAVLRKAREKRGAIDFDTQETRIVFDEQRKVARIEPVSRNDAHKLIEECMIAANVAAASFLGKKKLPTLYRVHPQPDADAIADLRSFLGEVGLQLGGGETPEPKDYMQVMRRIQDRPDKRLIETVLLRSLSQANYSADNVGHFGLAHEDYAHFTSPIRRYPDLLVHRGLKHLVQHGSKKGWPLSSEATQEIGLQCSLTERRADEAVRDAVDWLKCEYMQDKVGEQFSGLVTGVTSFGLFIQLDEVFVEGLVHVTALPDDYYHFDPVQHRLNGERSGRQYCLSDKLDVKVIGVNLDERKIDFELATLETVNNANDAAAAKRRAKGSQTKGKAGKTKPGKAKSAKAKNKTTKATKKKSRPKTQSISKKGS